MTRPATDDRFLTDKDRLKHAEAIAILRDRVDVVAGIETVPLVDAAGRILATPQHAPHPVPMHTNAAVDGYAFASSSYDRRSGTRFPVAARAAAGHRVAVAIPPGQAARIFTGAVMPEGTDTCAMQEDCVVLDQPDGVAVDIPSGLKAGANVRLAGEDVQAGSLLMPAGATIRPQDLAALASVGLADVPVHKRLRIGILSSGDEVVRPGRALEFGQVYDANMPMLMALASAMGATCVDLGVAPDRLDDVIAMLERANGDYDVLLTSGGASRGEEDHLNTALQTLGTQHLWQLAIKPGRPMSFGQIGSCVVLGLPGNPVAVMVCFLMYAWPMLRRMAGAPWQEPRRFMLPADFDFLDRKTGRREFWRGRIVERDGRMMVDKFKRDGSGLISSLRAADGLIEVGEDATDVRRGDLVAYIPFSEFGIVG